MEARKDYLLNRWVFYASNRKKRPREFKKPIETAQTGTCFFCLGNEALTPPEIGSVKEKSKWILRWFDNKFPAVEKSGNPKIKSNGLLTSTSAYGNHWVFVETNNHSKQLWDLNPNHITKILIAYKKIISDLSKKTPTKYVLIFKNHGREGGTSLIHSHSQIVSMNIIPPLLEEESNASEQYKKKTKKCAYCEIIKKELKSPRKCFENKYFAAFTPYASRYSFEAWLFPKFHANSITEISDDKLLYHAEILSKVLRKLKTLNVSFNFFLHNSPDGKDLHYHMEITPRVGIWAGFEIGGNAIINSITPEDAAKFYRGK